MPPLTKLTANIILLAVVAAALTAAVLIGLHTPWVTLPGYWHLPYRSLRFFPLYPLCWLALLPTVAGLWLFSAGKIRGGVAVALATLTAGGLMISASLCATDPPSLTAVRGVVLDPVQSTYLADAVRLNKDINAGRLTLGRFVADYPKFMVNLGVHTRIRGPGWIIVYIGLLNVTGGDAEAAAMIGAVGLGLLAAAAVGSTYWLIRVLGGTTAHGIAAAALISVLPSMVLFFPMVDPGYCTVTCVLVGLWAIALRPETAMRPSMMAAAGTGLLLGVSCLFTFNFLVLGLFMLTLTARGLMASQRRRTLLACGVALGGALLPFVALYLAMRFDIVSTFRQALVNEHEFQTISGRSGHTSALLDTYDHALGLAFALHVLLLAWMVLAVVRARSGRGAGRQRFPWRPAAFISVAALVQYIVLALTGRMPVETIRIWLFLNPLLLFPAAEVMVALGLRRQLILIAAVGLCVPVYAQNLYLVTWMKSQRTGIAVTQPVMQPGR